MIDGSEPILRVEALTRRFQGLVALDGVSFTVEPGTVYSIIGPNGAGKTTAFNCISGIYRPSGGTILFEGATISGLKPHKIARLGIARTFQNIELFANVTTMENLMLGRHVHMKAGLWGAATMLSRRSRAAREEVEHRERVERIIDLLDLGWARNRLVRGLPYGTQKLVELGRALALEPRLLLLDEPSAGMSSDERQDLIFWIKDIRAELDLTILLIEHHMRLAMGLADRVLALNFGVQIAEGTPDEVGSNPEVTRAYLGEDFAPQPAGLQAADGEGA